jgi:hypothetical protein
MDVNLVKKKDYLKEEFYKNRKIIYGGFKGDMSWPYYLSGFEKDLHERLELIKVYVKIFMKDMEEEFKNPRFYEFSFFLFDDTYSISFTERSWGDFMAAVTGKKNYKDFYGIEDSPKFN